MGDILYPKYRRYFETRVTVNNAMMALLAGSRLAGHTLQLTTGSKRTLAELFPAVEHIARFNLRSDEARSLLQNADHHLASVALPYALATHEEFVMSSIEFLKAEGFRIIKPQGKPIKAWSMHAALFNSAGSALPQDLMEGFDLLREMRNSTIHAGGAIQPNLTKCIAAMGQSSTAEWQRLNAQAPGAIVSTGEVSLSASHIFTAFAITKGLAREINAALSSAITKSSWARIAVEDYQEITSKTKNSSSWRRSLVGFARINYKPANLTEPDLEQAARKLGYWTLATWR
ncbi:hypothetical protein ABZ351_29150 [Streptomyces microflavus]|uniref:hypothetical protein n=1 Tax=Streptomyces microflavus TaxID=1919 RepID=UPI0033C6458F